MKLIVPTAYLVAFAAVLAEERLEEIRLVRGSRVCEPEGYERVFALLCKGRRVESRRGKLAPGVVTDRIKEALVALNRSFTLEFFTMP